MSQEVAKVALRESHRVDTGKPAIEMQKAARKQLPGTTDLRMV